MRYWCVETSDLEDGMSGETPLLSDEDDACICAQV